MYDSKKTDKTDESERGAKTFFEFKERPGQSSDKNARCHRK